jgi:predicted DNA-binding WGR domain protein
MEIRLEKHDPGKNLARYYRMSVHPNLFGEWTLQREWGRVRLDLFRSLSEAKSALKMLESAKQRRQYEKTLQAQHDHLKPS